MTTSRKDHPAIEEQGALTSEIATELQDAKNTTAALDYAFTPFKKDGSNISYQNLLHLINTKDLRDKKNSTILRQFLSQFIKYYWLNNQTRFIYGAQEKITSITCKTVNLFRSLQQEGYKIDSSQRLYNLLRYIMAMTKGDGYICGELDILKAKFLTPPPHLATHPTQSSAAAHTGSMMTAPIPLSLAQHFNQSQHYVLSMFQTQSRTPAPTLAPSTQPAAPTYYTTAPTLWYVVASPGYQGYVPTLYYASTQLQETAQQQQSSHAVTPQRRGY